MCVCAVEPYRKTNELFKIPFGNYFLSKLQNYELPGDFAKAASHFIRQTYNCGCRWNTEVPEGSVLSSTLFLCVQLWEIVAKNMTVSKVDSALPQVFHWDKDKLVQFNTRVGSFPTKKILFTMLLYNSIKHFLTFREIFSKTVLNSLGKKRLGWQGKIWVCQL